MYRWITKNTKDRSKRGPNLGSARVDTSLLLSLTFFTLILQEAGYRILRPLQRALAQRGTEQDEVDRHSIGAHGDGHEEPPVRPGTP